MAPTKSIPTKFSNLLLRLLLVAPSRPGADKKDSHLRAGPSK
jgi:hypothetical protein